MAEILSTQLIQTPILIFFPIFLTIYLTSYFIIFKNWSPKFRPEASSCAISLFHGTPAALLSLFSLFSQPQQFYFSQNTLLQNTILEYSIAYFIMDLTHYLIFYPSDILFIAHHLATLFVFITCRFLVSHGGYSILVLLFIAEITSLFQNVWTLASARRVDSEFAARVYNFLSPPFYVLYSFARGVLGPLFVFKMGCAFIRGENVGFVPNWVLLSWISVVVTAICVSGLWIWNLWVDLYRECYSYNKGFQKKVT